MSEEGVDLIENPIQQDADGTVTTPNQEKRVGSPEINPAIASLRRDFDELNNVTLGKNIEDFEALMLVEHTDSSIFPPISPTEVAAKADELVAYDESTAELKLTPIEFLKKAKHLEHSLLKTINNHENIGNLINKRIDIEVRLEMLNEKKGISAFRAKNEISRLKKQLENVAHARELEEQNQKKLELKLGGVRKRKEELIQQQLGTALYEVVSKSDTFFQKLADDEGLTKELNSSYFHNIIIPFLKTNPFGGDSWREKLEFYNAQYSHLAESPDSEAISTLTRKSPLLNKDMLWEQTAGAYSTKVRVLKANQRQLIRDKIVRLIKAADPEYAAFRKEEGYLALMTAVSRRQLSTLTPFRKINRKNFAQIIKDEVRPESYDIPMHYAISKTPTMNFILGNKRYDFEPEATRQGKTGNGMLENEFTFYNPTPENLIQLAILASKNSTSGSRQDDLPKTVLCALTKRDDWNEVVSKTIQKYPDFAEAAQTLSKKFDPKKLIINYTDLRDSLVDLQANILCKKGDVDNELWESVFYKADTKAFLGAFLNKGYVSEEEYVRLIYQKLWISLEETLRLRERLYDNEDKAKKAVARTLRLIDFGERPEAKRLVENRDFKTLVTDLDVSDEKVNFLYDLPQQYPELITTGLFMFALRGDKQDLYLDDEGIRFLMEYSKLYGYPEKFQPIGLLHAVEQDLLTRERVLELSGKMDNFDDLYEAALDPTVFLQTDEDIDFFYKFRNAWDDNGVKNLKSLCIKSLVQHDTNRNLILNLPTKCSWIGEKSKVNLAEKIFEYSYRLLETPEDINFINTLVGMHGNKAAPLLEGYVKCLDAEVIDKKNKDIVIEFTKKYRVLTPNLLSGYIAAKNEGTSEMYIAQLNSLLEGILGPKKLTEKQRESPFLQDLIPHIYPKNIEDWGTYEGIAVCEDRDSDLDKYVLPQNTRIDLLLNGKIHLRDGETFTEEDEDELFRPFREIEAKHYENERNKVDDYAVLDDDVVQIITWIKKDNGSTEQADVTLTHNQKMFELLLTSVYSNGNYIKDAKQLLLESAVLNTEFDASLSTYLDPEKQYRSLSELAEFYLDGMKEDIRAIVTEGFSHPRLSEMAKQYFQDLSLNAQVEQKQTEQNKLQADKLGLSKSFIALAGKQLERRYGRKLSTEEIIKIINRYEAVTGGLQEKSSTSTNKDTKAFYGTLRSQRNKTIDALRMVTEEDIDPQRLHLGEMNLEEALKAEKSIVKREYDEEQFASYTTQQFIDLFSEEKGNTVFHLRKFESESGSQRKTLNAFITKSKESAHARLSGGVCVSRDNPRTDIARQNIWDMENYIQLVLQDPDTLICQGLLLMHDNTDNGKRVLSVSFNPSSTFLFTADEESCFKALLAKAEEFAGLNNFDMIVSSPDGKGIRTNRVGGIFERAFKDKVEEKRKKFAFSEQRVFSYDPLYTMLDMDVLWEKPEENAQESS